MNEGKAKDLNRHFSKQSSCTDGQLHIKRCSTSLFARKMQMEITMRCHFTFLRIVIIKKKKQTITDADNNVEKLKPSYVTGGYCKTVQVLWKVS